MLGLFGAGVVAVPPLSGRVVDQTGTLSAGDIASLTQTLKDLETRKGSQIAVLIVPTTDGEAIEQFSLRVAEAWKIGRKKIDDGALLVIAKNDRRLRIEVGYGLEGALTDVTTKRIIDEDITPKFKTGDFAGGISAGVDRMIRVIDGEKLPEPEPPHWQDRGLLERCRPVQSVHPRSRRSLSAASLRSSARPPDRLGWRPAASSACWPGSWSAGIVAAAIAGVVGFIIAAVQRLLPSERQWLGGRRQLVRRLAVAVSSSSSSDSGGFSGGGGSFGGGGASGSW